jgi:hypothetical protein
LGLRWGCNKGNKIIINKNELLNLYFKSNIRFITVFKPTRMRLSEHLARIENREKGTDCSLKNLKERGLLGDVSVDGRTI